MSFILFLLSALIVRPSYGKDVTYYRWVVKEKSPPKGQCLEVDVETSGAKYYRKVSSPKCKPLDKDLTTLWLQKSDGPGGKCYIVDRKTDGEKYSITASSSKCGPKNYEYKLIEGRCYKYGTRDDGQSYLTLAGKKHCEPKNQKPVFIIDKKGSSGRCVIIDRQAKETFKQPLSKCRPKDLVYQAINISGKTQCFEVAKEGGAQTYIGKTALKNCTPKDIFLSWTQQGPLTGRCDFRSESVASFIKPVGALKCATLYKTRPVFKVISPVKGKCYLVDEATQGRKYKYLTDIKSCRPIKIKIIATRYNNKSYCLNVAEDSARSSYRETIGMSYCHSNTGNYVFRLNKDDTTKGICRQQYYIDNKEKFKQVSIDKCRPAKIFYAWFIKNKEQPLMGKCYEVAQEGGAQGFIKLTKSRHCLPKKKLKMQFYHPEKYKNGGCYLVGPDDGLNEYSQKTKYDKCKDLLKTI